MTPPRPTSPQDPGVLPLEAEVAVIGGGVAGICAAYHLAVAGVDVVVLERGTLGGGATGTSVGILAPPLFQPFDQMVHFRGDQVARAVWNFALRSIDGLAALLESRGASGAAGLDLSGGYVVAEGESLTEVRAAFDALEDAGFPVEWLSGDQVREITGGEGFPGGYRIQGGGCLSPVPAVQAVAEAAREAGGVIVEGVDVEDVHRLEGRLACDTNLGRLRAEMVVYATHVDVRRFSAFVGDEIVPIRGQAMMIETGSPLFRGAFSTHWRKNMWRSDPEGRLVIGGWRQEAWDRAYWKAKPRLDEELQETIHGWFRSTFPDLAARPVVSRWSGIYGWTADYLPLVGPLPGRPGEMVLSGFSGGGLSFAFEAGRAIAAMVTEGETVPGTDLINPRRFT